jgi:hypothetical protein
MLLPRGHHLAYCTNIHPAETWPETLAALEEHTLAVRARVCPDRPFAIGLRLSDLASRQLSEPSALLHFRRWLERKDCYVFTINGFPFGRFHGGRIKEQVYLPDWTSRERLDYTNRLFDLLAQLLPEGVAGSVSTLPGSFKEFITTPAQLAAIRENLLECVKHISAAAARSGRELHLGLEPEPLGLLETTGETVEFFDRLRASSPGDSRLDEYLGVNYDTCHLAVEFEEPAEALARLQSHGIKISKIHLSSALKFKGPLRLADGRWRIPESARFAGDTYLHQVIACDRDGQLSRYKDLADLLTPTGAPVAPAWEEFRIHFHIPLHATPSAWFDTTSDHLLGVLDTLAASPNLCSHLEMETYTWEVLPAELKNRSVVEQLAAEYEWCLGQLRRRGLA